MPNKIIKLSRIFTQEDVENTAKVLCRLTCDSGIYPEYWEDFIDDAKEVLEGLGRIKE